MARRKPKKKSNNGIWIGTAISLGVICIIAVAFYVKMQPNAVAGTTKSSDEANLVKQTLPTGLPNFGISPSGNNSTASDLFMTVKAANKIGEGGYEDKPETLEQAKQVTDALRMTAASDLKAGFFDKMIKDKEFESDTLSQNIVKLNKAVMLHLDHLRKNFQYDEATRIAEAYLAFGQQAFEKNVKLKARQRGLIMIRYGAQQISLTASEARKDGEWDDKKVDAVFAETKKWIDAVGKVSAAWNAKLSSNESVNSKEGKPNVADLVKIANEDEDLTFRIYAALRLGYALYERGDPGNQQAIKAALDELEASDEPKVAAAAKAGRSIKDREEYHELR